jgi:exonuclease VII large subunit
MKNKLAVLKQNDDDAKTFQDMINAKAERLDSRIVSFRKIMEEDMEKKTQEIEENIAKLRGYVNDEAKRLDSSIFKTKNLCIEVIELNKETLQSELNEDLAETKTQIEEVRLKIEERLQQTLEDSNKKVSKIKDI